MLTSNGKPSMPGKHVDEKFLSMVACGIRDIGVCPQRGRSETCQ
jgi:hypothetical protein